MPEPITLLSVVGARPQFVKLAPVSRAIERREDVSHRVAHTGQHYDQNMSASFFEQLEMSEPDINLGIGSGSHAEQTAAMLIALESVLVETPPDAVLVYGDTNSTLAATLAAAKIHVPVAHIEAGLRSFNREMPEEVNRLVADHCGDRLYAPTPKAMENLAAERLADRAVISGDVMLDAVLHNIELANQKSDVLSRLDLESKAYGLVTVHRPVNTTGEALESLMATLEKTALEQLPLVFPVHPRTRAALNGLGYQPPAELMLLEPLPYLDNLRAIEAAKMVITDSGGVQKEAAFLKTPCITLRDETEWTETVDIGVNRLVGNAGPNLETAVEDCIAASDPFDASTIESLAVHYGDGAAADVIVSDCVEWLKVRREDKAA